MIRKNTTFCICDFETTGVDPEKDFPIEIGCIFTDSNFIVKNTMQSLIRFPEVVDKITDGDYVRWPAEWTPAFDVHKIDAYKIRGGFTPESIAADLIEIVNEIKVDKTSKCIILSDNAQFEYRFMEKIFKHTGKKFPFHYCAWDTSLLLEASGVKDPIPVHRAFADASLLHHAVVRAMERCDFYETNK